MKSKLGFIALLMSALVFHDFFKIEAFKLGLLTLTYQRIVIIAIFPIILFSKLKINIKDNFLRIIIIFAIYGLLRICGNYREALVIYFPLITFILIYIIVNKESEISFCINFLATTFILFSIIGFIEIKTGYHFVETYHKSNTKGLAVGMYYNENDFAAFLTTMIFYMLLSSFPILVKFFSISTAIYIIYLNGSQTCLLGIVTFVFLYFIFIIRDKNIRFIMFVTAIVLVCIFKKVFINIILKSSLHWRFLMYQTGVKVCMNNLFFGTGIGNYEKAMYDYGLVEAPFVSANPHNLFLELSGQFGIIWLILLIYLLIQLFLYLYKKINKNKLFLLGLLYIYPFVSIASSSSLGKNYTYLALLIPLVLLKKERSHRYKKSYEVLNDYRKEYNNGK
ncbi:MAG: O-antigen ligase family protein [Spirochaetaceae bacterium]|nr:O-antigen ligase family protein [Spirochaetaceae bacterium]